MGSSELRMGAGEDTIDFVGTDAPGAAQLRTVDVKLGAGNDLLGFLVLPQPLRPPFVVMRVKTTSVSTPSPPVVRLLSFSA